MPFGPLNPVKIGCEGSTSTKTLSRRSDVASAKPSVSSITQECGIFDQCGPSRSSTFVIMLLYMGVKRLISGFFRFKCTLPFTGRRRNALPP